MWKMGDKSRAFVEKAGIVAANNPDIMPRSFDLAACRRGNLSPCLWVF
jgi:hypothetical protein